MKSLTKKTNLFFATVVVALSLAFAIKASVPHQHFHQLLAIKNRAISTSTKPKPEELENQLKTVMGDLEKTGVHEQLLNQLLEIAADVARRNNDAAKKVKDELSNLNFKMNEVTDESGNVKLKAPTADEIAQLSYHEKAAILRSLSLESRIVMFERIGDKVFGSRTPFKIPTETTTISQLDMFFVLALVLTIEEAEKDETWRAFHNSLMSCIGLKDVTKIQTRLNKPAVNALIPEGLKTKFFTHNPAKLVLIVQHIKALMATHA